MCPHLIGGFCCGYEGRCRAFVNMHVVFVHGPLDHDDFDARGVSRGTLLDGRPRAGFYVDPKLHSEPYRFLACFSSSRNSRDGVPRIMRFLRSATNTSG